MADVILEVTVPDAWTVKVLDAFNAITDTNIEIEVRSLGGSWNFNIGNKLPAESNKQFGERVLRELGKAIVHMVDKAEDRIRYNNEVAAITPPISDVSDDILT